MEQGTWAVAVVVVAVILGLGLIAGRAVRYRGSSHRAARTDALTGLPNRLALDEATTAALADAAHGTAAHGPALLLLDLDGFKDVNDTLGHAAGDTVLVQVAQRLRTAVRDGDLVTRLGGDEFAVLARAPIDEAAATMLGKTVLAALGSGGFTAGLEVDLDIGGSIGIATAPDSGTDIGDLLRHADLAMYQAKRTRAGVGHFEAGDSGDPTEGHDRLTTLSLVRGAMEHDELLLHYQPVVDASGALRSFEVLLRWDHPTRGLMMPGDFLPAAERTSLIRPLTRWVLLGATRQGARWLQAGLDVTLAVNISATMLEPGLLGILDEALARSRFPADHLVLEVTESAVASSAEEARTVLAALRARGFAISIDDFGAGSTGLHQLRDLDFTHLKVDRQFVTGMLQRPVDEAITATIIDLAHRLGAIVVAEGIEDAATAARLVELGCDHLQGYWLGLPVPAVQASLQWMGSVGQAPAASVAPDHDERPVVALLGAHGVDHAAGRTAAPPTAAGG